MNARLGLLTLAALLPLPEVANSTTGPRPAGEVTLGWQIAHQGNRALTQIITQARSGTFLFSTLEIARVSPVGAAGAVRPAHRRPMPMRSAKFSPVVSDDIPPALIGQRS